jgi:hypothetical protein
MKTVPVFLIITVVSCIFAKHVELTIDELIASSNYYLSQINWIGYNGSNKLVLRGTMMKEKNITGKTVYEIMQMCQSGLYPECIIDYTQSEIDAYLTFRDEFVKRPLGSDGSRAAYTWISAKTYQNVTTNLSKNSILADNLFNADLKLKQMIMGKKRLRVSGLISFCGYVEFALFDAIKESGGRTFYLTKFYLVPDTLIMKKGESSIEIKKVKFKLVSSEKYESAEDKRTFEDLWAEEFNKKIEKVMTKNKELFKIQEVFKLFCMMKEIVDTSCKLEKTNFEHSFQIPEKIMPIKHLTKISFPDPLINEPARYRFCWLMMSGAITFDYRNAVVLIE